MTPGMRIAIRYTIEAQLTYFRGMSPDDAEQLAQLCDSPRIERAVKWSALQKPRATGGPGFTADEARDLLGRFEQ